jgi:phosphoglycolate phosphatase
MKSYTIVFFDLDGTLIESGPGIIKATRAMMKDLGLQDMSDEEMKKFVGPPLVSSFSEFLGLSGEDVHRAIALYRMKYDEMGLSVTSPYPMVPELLRDLKARGKKLGVVTSKIHPTAEAHLKRFGLWQYIDYLRGADPVGIGEKAELLKLAVSDNITEIKQGSAVMVGDRMFDLDAAHVVGIDSIGVLYGYGSKKEIEECRPTHIAKSVNDLAGILLA